MAHTYRIELKYIGREFDGWQTQPSKNSVQDHVEKALKTVLREDVRVVGSSRTDAGVHAEHQVAMFSCEQAVEIKSLFRSLNALVPPTIGVSHIEKAEENFHPILSAKAKLYCYRVWLGVRSDPFLAPFVWIYPYGQIDLKKMSAQAKAFIGLHDFTSFCAADSGAKTRHRKILDIAIEQDGPLYTFWILGEGFLKQMVRAMVGTLMEIGFGKRETDIAQILDKKDRASAGQSAPAAGLTLMKVFYDDPPTLATYLDRRNTFFRHEKPRLFDL
jgi:tRNA pseudouridine38-40 synthase